MYQAAITKQVNFSRQKQNGSVPFLLYTLDSIISKIFNIKCLKAVTKNRNIPRKG